VLKDRHKTILCMENLVVDRFLGI